MERFKLYKSGKHWVAAGISIANLSLMVGMAQLQQASADNNNPSNGTNTTQVIGTSNTNGSAAGIPTSAATVTGSGAISQSSLTSASSQSGTSEPTQSNTNTTSSQLLPDKNLQDAVTRQLKGKEITKTNLSQLENLNLRADGVQSLAGLENATNLKTLDISFNKISDLTPLAKLTNLQTLSFDFNKLDQLPDLTPLQGLTRLTNLSIAGGNLGNNANQLKIISGLSQLQDLDLQANKLTSVPDLSQMKNLTHLNLMSNKIADLSPLSMMTQLTELKLISNSFTDVQPLAQLTNLQSLQLGMNKIQDVTALSDLKQLTSLSLGQTNVNNESLKTVGQLTNLQKLVLDFNHKISDLTPLANLNQLKTLYLDKDSISNLQPLANLTQLEELTLSNNQVQDLQPLAKLTNLQTLNLLKNQVTDLTPLHDLTKLTALNVRNQNITLPTQTFQANQAKTQTISIKDIDGHAVPLTAATDTKATVDANNQITYTDVQDKQDAHFSWENSKGTNTLTQRFTGTITQPIEIQSTQTTTPQPVKLTVLAGDGSNQTSMASHFISSDAKLTDLGNHKHQLDITVNVPESYGKDSISFANGQLVENNQIDKQYVMTYRFNLSDQDLQTSNLLESMHVNIPSMNYIHDYDVYFKIAVPQQNQGNSSTNQVTPNQGQNSKNIKLAVLKGDGSNETSVASNFVSKDAKLSDLGNQQYQLDITVTVPKDYGADSITFANGKQLSSTQVGEQYIMSYRFNLTQQDLQANNLLESMHVNIPSFGYNHEYNVYFKFDLGQTQNQDTDKTNQVTPNQNQNQGSNNQDTPDQNSNQNSNNQNKPDTNQNQGTDNTSQVTPDQNQNQGSNNQDTPNQNSNQNSNNQSNPDTNQNQGTDNTSQVTPDQNQNHSSNNQSKPETNQNQGTDNTSQVTPDQNQTHDSNSQVASNQNQGTDNTSQVTPDQNQTHDSNSQVAPNQNQNQDSNNQSKPEPNQNNTNNQSRTIKVSILKGDGSNQLSVAAHFMNPDAQLTDLGNQQYQLDITAAVPENYGKDSITFTNGKQISTTKVGDQYHMVYRFNLSQKDLDTNNLLENMHVNIPSFGYDHEYGVYFKFDLGHAENQGTDNTSQVTPDQNQTHDSNSQVAPNQNQNQDSNSQSKPETNQNQGTGNTNQVTPDQNQTHDSNSQVAPNQNQNQDSNSQSKPEANRNQGIATNNPVHSNTTTTSASSNHGLPLTNQHTNEEKSAQVAGMMAVVGLNVALFFGVKKNRNMR